MLAMTHPLRLLTLAAALTSASAAADVPTYSDFELQARTNLLVNDNGFNLPPGASFNSITVDMNDSAQVTFHVQVVPGTNSEGIWFGAAGDGEIVCYSQNVEDAGTSDPKLNNAGAIVYRQRDAPQQNGVYSCNSTTGVITRVTAGPLGASNWDTPEINGSGQIGYRAGFGSGQAFVSYASGAFAIHATEVGIEVGSPYDFLFSPSFDDLRRLTGVVSYAGTSFAHREIRRFAADASSVSIADTEIDAPGFAYSSFDNSLSANTAGQVGFVATLTGGTRVVLRSDGTTTTQIARVGVAGLTAIDAFAAAINASGLVAFRGSDANGQAIFIGDGTTLRRVVGKGDAMSTDLGAAQIGQHDSSPVFGGGIALNTRGDIAFTAALHPTGNNQQEWGTGVFVAYADGGTPLPDPLFKNGFED
jgi:hypothetical protein